jgi:hypothetical protein
MTNARVHTDERGNRWLTNDNGEFLRDEAGDRIPAAQAAVDRESSGFRTFRTEQGHCALCGRLGCHGGCFK